MEKREIAKVDAAFKAGKHVVVQTAPAVRAAALYAEGERQVLRQSHNNPQIKQLYADFLGAPNSHKAHHLLHTHYQAREGFND